MLTKNISDQNMPRKMTTLFRLLNAVKVSLKYSEIKDHAFCHIATSIHMYIITYPLT